MYTKDNAYPASSFYITEYGKSVTIRNCSKQTFSLGKLHLRQTFEELQLNSAVYQPLHVDDAHDY